MTQFEATDARRCFPCWDEPAVKARFAVSIIAPKDRTVHSNMPEATAAPAADSDLEAMAAGATGDGLKLVQFDLSPVMSTYLVAIVVGEFEACESKTKDGITVRCLTPIGKVRNSN